MCLAAVALGLSERFPWVLASNRDEFFDRGTAGLAWWLPAPGAEEILSGRDLAAGGTWMGLNRRGRLALVTNVRESGHFDAASPSRGALVPQWLGGASADWLDTVAAAPRNGFNLLALDLAAGTGHWVGNRPPAQRALGPGLWGVSNAALDTPWPKLLRLKQALRDALQADDAQALTKAALAALADDRAAPDHELPRTGVPLEHERALSPAFIRLQFGGRAYGTRCSTVLVAERRAGALHLHLVERGFDADGRALADVAHTLTLPV